jgi:superfamily II DNA or RNA helicase/DNA-binding XRE family transcriptional regulator
MPILTKEPKEDYSSRIKQLRTSLGLTQQSLAQRLGVSFATINRWENGQTRPSAFYWKQLRQLEQAIAEQLAEYVARPQEVRLDFTANPEAVKILAEGERLSFGHLMNPTFATEISSIDPLPHQRIAVYEHMLRQPRLRFLLADDAGAGKTIMSGLYIREMLSRRLLGRVLIVTPAGLVGNWQNELSRLFNLYFRIVTGNDFRFGNPFSGENSDLIIISIDTLATTRAFNRLKDENIVPYDLVIFDEAHKLSASRTADLRVKKTDRYALAEAIAGVKDIADEWKLGWAAHHLLLLTATPHMGKDYPYFALWRLLEPETLCTPEAFAEYPSEARRLHFIRRTKEEMVYLDGRPLYPKRISSTHGFDLSQGDISEQRLYDETTEYLQYVYNRAKLLNREAARLALSVFQRRLASSTYALLQSFGRRIEKLDKLINDVQDGKITSEQLAIFQQRLAEEEEDVLDTKTADEETPEDGREENEAAEDKILEGVVAASLTDLLAERERVQQLQTLAQRVYDLGVESKFDKLKELLTDPQYSGEKFIIFTEYRDTLTFLVNRLRGLGFTNQVAQIHGGMDYRERQTQVDFFKKPVSEGGARFLVCTDAAGEGINLQFCWIMINYDIPWNPARLEQRMGRIHRYGQKHDPVVILNIIAPKTREGFVLNTLLEKLEKIRKEMRSDKVFDCIGRMFEGASLKRYLELALLGKEEEAARELDGRLTAAQVQAIAEREKRLYGEGGDVVRELPRLHKDVEREMYFKLLPGYVRHYTERAAKFLELSLEENGDNTFTFKPEKPGALDKLLVALESYPTESRDRFVFSRPDGVNSVIWLHPGEPVFERFRSLVSNKLMDQALRGSVFVDPTADKPYLFHLAVIKVLRKADPQFRELSREEVLECKLVALKQCEGSELTICPVEQLLLLRGALGIPPMAQRLALDAENAREQAEAFLLERVCRETAIQRKKKLESSIPEREAFITRGFDFQEAELAAKRANYAEKARGGSRRALHELELVKHQQRMLAQRKEHALAVLRREPELIEPGEIRFLAHALVVPTSDPIEIEEHETNVEQLAMRWAIAYEEAQGATVIDVHSPDLARAAGLPDYPGFDLLSLRANGERRSIEVKGRAEVGPIEISANEWAKACNLGKSYWLYVVFNCAAESPTLYRIQDPFNSLIAKSKGSLLIDQQQIAEFAFA